MFSNEEIKQLAKPNNHKIKFDGYDYWWYTKINGKWDVHCIEPFKTHLKAIKAIKYWLVQYAKMDAENEMTFEKMVNNVMDEVRIYDIANNTNLKTIDKVVAILNINPYLNQVELAEYLNVTKMGICKQLKKLKKFTK
jgi:hypothetical protein